MRLCLQVVFKTYPREAVPLSWRMLLMLTRAPGSLQTIGSKEQQDRMLLVTCICVERNTSSKIAQRRTTSLSSTPRQSNLFQKPSPATRKESYYRTTAYSSQRKIAPPRRIADARIYSKSTQLHATRSFTGLC
jgi:hypothetical protein